MPDDETDRTHTERVLENERAHGTVGEVSATIAELDRELAKPTGKPVGTPTACFALLVLCATVLPVLGVGRDNAFMVGLLAAVAYLVAVHDTLNRVRRRRQRRHPELRERRRQLLSALGCGDPDCSREPCREAFDATRSGPAGP